MIVALSGNLVSSSIGVSSFKTPAANVIAPKLPGTRVGTGVFVGCGVDVGNGVLVGRGVDVGNGVLVGNGVAVGGTGVGVGVGGGAITEHAELRTSSTVQAIQNRG